VRAAGILAVFFALLSLAFLAGPFGTPAWLLALAVRVRGATGGKTDDEDDDETDGSGSHAGERPSRTGWTNP
jgi:hypothetical protein